MIMKTITGCTTKFLKVITIYMQTFTTLLQSNSSLKWNASTLCNQAKHRFPGLYDVQRHNMTCITIHSLYSMPDLCDWSSTKFVPNMTAYSHLCACLGILSTMHQQEYFWHRPLRAQSANEIWFTVLTFPDHLTVFNRTACSFWTETSWHNPSTYDSTWTIRWPTKALLSKYQHIPTVMTLRYFTCHSHNNLPCGQL